MSDPSGDFKVFMAYVGMATDRLVRISTIFLARDVAGVREV